MTNHIAPVAADHIYHLFNLGSVYVVSAQADGQADAMPASWCCNLDLVPAKATAVIDKSHFTRKLVEKSGYFALQLPTAAIVETTLKLGSESKNDHPNKLEECGAKFFTMPGFEEVPLLEGCVAWAIYRVIPEPHNQQTYDLFIGEAVAAWADPRVFTGNRWNFDGHDELRTLHYVSGGQFFVTGKAIEAKGFGA